MRGLTAFRESFLASDAAHMESFESVEARQMRYSIYWASFENTAYRRVHNWSVTLKHQYALYKYVRSLYNPSYRIGSFYAAHLWGGRLSPEAGPEGAIPIETENEALRIPVATLWQTSNWGTQKDIVALRGTVEGDAILRIADDTDKERVYIERINPGTVVDLTLDAFSNVKGYIIEEERPDPRNVKRAVTYREVVTRSGDDVVYETFLNNKPYGWDGQPEQWTNPYTFVPMVLIKHMDVGLDWGWSELHAMRSKVMEVDDLASMVSDQIRKSVDPVWLMKGMKATTITATGAQADETGGTDTRPEPGREELKAIWGAPADAEAAPMLADLNLEDALQHIKGLLGELERDYPELQQDIWSVGATSGRALRIARQRVEAKVLQRREAYDAGLVKLQKMAIAIGGFRGYEGYEGFSLESYAQGALDHRIAQRAVFAPDILDEVEIRQAEWTAAKMAVGAGADLGGYLKQAGWEDEDILEVVSTEEREAPEERGNEEAE